MAGFLILIGLVGLAYGMLRPDGALPTALGAPSRLKVAGLYGTVFLFGTAMGSGGDGSAPTEVAGSVDSTATASNWPPGGRLREDPWPGRDSTVAALASLVEAGAYVQAADEARRHVAEPYAASAADTLRRIADGADELALYELAQRIPGSNLQGNRDAYASLATRYPSSPRAALYTQKRADYDQRIIDADAARYRAAIAPRPRARSGGGGAGCCKRCSAGKPCGDTCIARNKTCHRSGGCAC